MWKYEGRKKSVDSDRLDMALEKFEKRLLELYVHKSYD